VANHGWRSRQYCGANGIIAAQEPRAPSGPQPTQCASRCRVRCQYPYCDSCEGPRMLLDSEKICHSSVWPTFVSVQTTRRYSKPVSLPLYFSQHGRDCGFKTFAPRRQFVPVLLAPANIHGTKLRCDQLFFQRTHQGVGSSRCSANERRQVREGIQRWLVP